MKPGPVSRARAAAVGLAETAPAVAVVAAMAAAVAAVVPAVAVVAAADLPGANRAGKFVAVGGGLG
jgi:hypothetical protein